MFRINGAFEGSESGCNVKCEWQGPGNEQTVGCKYPH